MSTVRFLFLITLIAVGVSGAFGQTVTSSINFDRMGPRPGAFVFMVREPESNTDSWSRRIIDQRITFGLEDELVNSGFLPVATGRPFDFVVSFYFESNGIKNPSAAMLDSDVSSLIVEFDDMRTGRTIWRGAAAAVNGLDADDPYQRENRMVEAARMLVRRFTEEMNLQ